jgi:NADP-dependent 3-hydroxy acid dehydrogenase YdfG
MAQTNRKPLVGVVAGATGALGEGITLALLAAGWRVHALGRDAEKLQSLVSRVPGNLRTNLQTHSQDFENAISTEKTCENVLAASSYVDMVVASIGAWWQGPLLHETSLEDWRAVMCNSLDAHFLCAKQWLPALRQNAQSAYVMINGGAALSPVPHAGAISVSATAQLALKNILVVEARDKPPRVYSVLANTPVITKHRREGKSGWLTTTDIAEACSYCHQDFSRTHHGATLTLNEKPSPSTAITQSKANWHWT